MAKVRTITKPVIESVELILTPAEATLLASMVGQISGGDPNKLSSGIYDAFAKAGFGSPYQHGRAVNIREIHNSVRLEWRN